MWSCDPRRFTGYTDPAYCQAKAVETYGHEYAMHFPWHRWPAGADRKLSPLHSRLQAAGAVFGAYNGWERANWFARPGDDVSDATPHTWDRAGPWQPRLRAECEAVQMAVACWRYRDLPGWRCRGRGRAIMSMG